MALTIAATPGFHHEEEISYVVGVELGQSSDPPVISDTFDRSITGPEAKKELDDSFNAFFEEQDAKAQGATGIPGSPKG